MSENPRIDPRVAAAEEAADPPADDVDQTQRAEDPAAEPPDPETLH